MLTEGKVRAIAAQVASAIVGKIKPSVSEDQIRSDVEAVVRQMKENGELTGSDLTDEQIVAVQENAEAAESAKGEAQTAATNAGKSATAAAGSATTASNAATAAQTAQGAAETAQKAAESAKSMASQKATEATNAAQTATSKATEASQSATAAGTAQGKAETAQGEAEESAEAAAASATAAGTAKTAAETAAARAEEAANRLLGVAVVGVIETVNGEPAIVLTGVEEAETLTAYYKIVNEDGTETLAEIGQLVPKEETVAYTIKWCNYDGTILETDTVTEGATPTYDGETPTRDADSEYTYTFAGWTPEVVAATADATYTAVYNKTAIEVEPTTYTVTFVADGVTVAAVSYEEGATSITEPAVPEKDGYTGAWEAYILDGNITVNAVYTAIETGPTNFADPTSGDWKTECRLTTWIDQTTAAGSVTNGVVTNYIDVQSGDYIEVTGINFTDTNNRIAWDFGGTYGSISRASAISGSSFTGLSYDASSFKATVAAPQSDSMQIRFSGPATNGSEGVVINIKRDGSWL